ncbi:MAG: hypothetical protein E7072_04955 [Bacteroidales bacterium]|jgi:hypothetical protein|nr:hypothetical protein [Bacteroidales bacterium]
MATKEDKEIDKQTKELFELILKKTGIKKKDFFDMSIDSFIKHNLDLITPAEKKKFTKLVL